MINAIHIMELVLPLLLMAALGLFEASEAQQKVLKRALAELVATVAVLKGSHLLEQLDAIKAKNEQIYLDFVGDSAHAVRGLDLATGASQVRY